MSPEHLLIHEIYRSIQGESSFVGLPCVFVRTVGCNLRCRWCDTPQAFTGGERRTVVDVVQQALALGPGLVEVTGGEPLLQAGVLPLLEALCDAGRTVLIETSGERDISRVDPRVHRIVDLKAPGSGESERNRWENLALLTARDELKLVLADRADYEWAREQLRTRDLGARVSHVHFSPVHGQLDPQALIEWVLEDGLPVRVNLQVHKYIWGKDAEGV